MKMMLVVILFAPLVIADLDLMLESLNCVSSGCSIDCWDDD